MEGTVYSLNDELPFGKHKGELVEDVVYLDPEYLDWCVENVEGFELDDEAFMMLQNYL